MNEPTSSALIRVDRKRAAALQSERGWTKIRYEVFKIYGPKCACCDSLDGPFHVDHIKPKSRYPELWDRIDNLQILCSQCNLGKGDEDEIDWRERRLKIKEEAANLKD